MRYKQVRNIYGQALTKSGAVDKRQLRVPQRENDGKAYLYYEVNYRPGDARPWHVASYVVDTGERELVSRHRLEKQAIRAAEKLRIKQPDRKPSAKLIHKLRAY